MPATEQEPTERPLENIVELSKKLMEVKGKTAREKKLIEIIDAKGRRLKATYNAEPTEFEEILDEDMTLANLSGKEIEVVRLHGNLSNYTQSFSRLIGVDLSAHQSFIKNQLKLFLVSSRAKSGFTAWLTKTEKSISEQFATTMQKQLAYEEQKSKPFWKKIF